MPLGEEIPCERGRQRRYPLRNRYFTNSSSVITFADRHRLVAYHKKHCWRTFRGYQHRWLWTTLNLKNRGFGCFFFAILGCDIFQEWIAPKSLDIDHDNLHVKFSALNVNFNSLRFDPLRSSSPYGYGGVKFGYPIQNALLLHVVHWFARWRHSRLMLLRVSWAIT